MKYTGTQYLYGSFALQQIPWCATHFFHIALYSFAIAKSEVLFSFYIECHSFLSSFVLQGRPEFYKNIKVDKRTFLLQELENF